MKHVKATLYHSSSHTRYCQTESMYAMLWDVSLSLVDVLQDWKLIGIMPIAQIERNQTFLCLFFFTLINREGLQTCIIQAGVLNILYDVNHDVNFAFVQF